MKNNNSRSWTEEMRRLVKVRKARKAGEPAKPLLIKFELIPHSGPEAA